MAYIFRELFDKFNEELVVVRGLRNSADYEYEKTVEAFTKECDVSTIYIHAEPEVRHISSSLIRNLVKAKKSYSHLMPNFNTYELMERFLEDDYQFIIF